MGVLVMLLQTSFTTYFLCTWLILIGAAAPVIGDPDVPSIRTPGVTYRSIIGDPGMRWKPGAAEGASSAWLQRPGTAAAPASRHVPATATAGDPGPRMQLFFYGLCSKAGYSNLSVLPEASDTCETQPGVIGMGVVATINSTNCCAACLARPWCLAWTQTREGSCDLKDNALAAAKPPASPIATLGQPVPGCCGQTSWSTGCNASSSGAWKAKDHGITTMDDCVTMCKSCPSCVFVSFSPSNDATGDCSWYSSCELGQVKDYKSEMVHNASSPSVAVVSGVRRYHPATQELPSPRYGNCVVDGKQTVAPEDNAAIGYSLQSNLISIQISTGQM
jgi:hypothetical protein